MTPQERQMIDELFDRLAKLDAAPRDSEAEAAIIAGLRRAPNATYALVQTVLVQDEALRRANDRIEELEGREPAHNPPGGFLDSMRGTMGLDPAPSRGSVPNVQPSAGGSSRPVWNTGQVLNAAPQQGADYADPRAAGAMPAGGGSSFLGTAAAAAAGMIGGSLLMNSIRGLTGGGQQQSLGGLGGASTASGDKASPWSKDSSGGDLARDAGLGDIGKGGADAQKQSFADQDDSTRQDYASNDADDDDDSDSDDDDDYDDDGDDGDDGDGSDFA